MSKTTYGYDVLVAHVHFLVAGIVCQFFYFYFFKKRVVLGLQSEAHASRGQLFWLQKEVQWRRNL